MPPSSPPMAGGRRNPRTVRIVVVLIAIILAISGAVVFYVLTQSSACNFSSTDPLIFDQPERPDTLDPHVTFSTPGWGIVQQIYQTLVNYNGSSYTTYVPVLAKSWSVSADNLNYTFVLHGGNGYLDAFPYAFLLASISGPIASAVDPKVIQQNGQVHYTQENTWMTTHMVGTGPYVLTGGFLDPTASSYTLKPDPNYWAINASKAEPLNNIIQPAHASIQVDFQNDAAIAVNDMKTGKVMSASFAYIGPSTVQSLQGVPCVAANALDTVYGSTAGGWWIYMNQNTDPSTKWSVRQAVVHGVSYPHIVDVAFGGHAERWVGPVPPGYPYYNPDHLAPYEYNLTLAKKFMSESPWPNGYPTEINYEYVNLGDWADVAKLLQDDLKQIKINIKPTKIDNLDNLYELQKRNLDGNCIAQNATGGGPFPIGQEFYTSDYISPDDWTQNNAISYGSANDCMAAYNDPAMDTLVLDAATQTDASTARTEYAHMTRLMYDNATVAWLVVPTQFQVVNTHLQGFVSNPMGAAIPFVVTQNTAVARKG